MMLKTAQQMMARKNLSGKNEFLVAEKCVETKRAFSKEVRVNQQVETKN
jgi:hypothetical protein